jgi:uncharacterized protein YerC
MIFFAYLPFQWWVRNANKSDFIKECSFSPQFTFLFHKNLLNFISNPTRNLLTMNFPHNPLINRLKLLVRRKEQQFSIASKFRSYLQKYTRRTVLSLRLILRSKMEAYHLNFDIKEVKLIMEYIKSGSLHKKLCDDVIPIRENSTHLSLSQRRQIQQGIAEGKSNAQIAREVGVHRSTIGREIKRNALQREYYNALQAQYLSGFNQRMAQSLRRSKLTEEEEVQEIQAVEEKIAEVKVRKIDAPVYIFNFPQASENPKPSQHNLFFTHPTPLQALLDILYGNLSHDPKENNWRADVRNEMKKKLSA